MTPDVIIEWFGLIGLILVSSVMAGIAGTLLLSVALDEFPSFLRKAKKCKQECEDILNGYETP